MTYTDLAKNLPAPSAEQAREFAEYVTGAHSWYKHLRIHPPVPFVFYLDPNAGRSMVHVSDTEVAFFDNVDEKDAFHYTWQKTETYRRRFGFWNYHAPYGRSFQYASAHGVADTAGSGLSVLSEDVGWLEIPKRLALAGTALVSSLMYGSRDRQFFVEHFGPDHESACAFVSPPMALGGEIVRNDPLFDGVAADVIDASRELQKLWAGADYAREKIETYRAWNEMCQTAFADPRPFDEAVPPEVSHAVHERTTQVWEATESRRKERALIPSLVETIERERQRQAAGMIAAMDQFVAVLHSDSIQP